MAAAREAAELLKRRLSGEVRFDRVSRQVYANDASMYQIEPVGVVLPANADDVVATTEVANQLGIPILPRGAGTSLAGQAVGHAIVLDFTAHMNRLLEVDTEAMTAWVEPGLVRDELNALLAARGVLFGPDTSSSNRATIGGMVGNNSAGSHSVVYGKTIDHVIELRCVLADGSVTTLRAEDAQGRAERARRDGVEGAIFRELPALAERNRAEIERQYPRLMRRVSGYNLDELCKPGPLNLAHLVVGSEGTLATVVAVKVKLERKPQMSAVVVVHFADTETTLGATPPILTTAPHAIEMIDQTVLDLARKSPVHGARVAECIDGHPGAVLLVEYAGESEVELRSKVENLTALLARERIGIGVRIAFGRREQDVIWKVRKAGLGLLMGQPGARKGLAFVEDTAVPPEKMAPFMRDFQAVLHKHGTHGSYYGHCSVGCLHIRPFIDLRSEQDRAAMPAIMREVVDLVKAYGGALSGEHGDGLARSQWNERLFGSTLYQAFRQVKQAFDPKKLLNPGKIVDAPDMLENLRYGPKTPARVPDTRFRFYREGGLLPAIEMCNGVGVCRKTREGTMCPSYMVTRDERQTTRGRANALRQALSGNAGAKDFTDPELHQVLDSCLQCKACKNECPSNVDMAKLKSEFLHHYNQEHGVSRRTRFVARTAKMFKVGSALAPLSNWIGGTGLARAATEKLFGFDRRRGIPKFARQSFRKWLAKNPGTSQSAAQGAGSDVFLIADTFNNYVTPEVLIAATELLRRTGHRVRLADLGCCGRPLIAKGMLDEAAALAAENIASLSAQLGSDGVLVGVEPSCSLTLRDEYPDLVATPEARDLAGRSQLVEELVAKNAPAVAAAAAVSQRRALLHTHCHQKALVGSGPTVTSLQQSGYQVDEVDAGCCGMAGAFGYETEHYELSCAIGNQRLAPAVRSADPDAVVVAPGFSCRQQIAHLTDRRAVHPVQAMLAALDEEKK